MTDENDHFRVLHNLLADIDTAVAQGSITCKEHAKMYSIVCKEINDLYYSVELGYKIELLEEWEHRNDD